MPMHYRMNVIFSIVCTSEAKLLCSDLRLLGRPQALIWLESHACMTTTSAAGKGGTAADSTCSAGATARIPGALCRCWQSWAFSGACCGLEATGKRQGTEVTFCLAQVSQAGSQFDERRVIPRRAGEEATLACLAHWLTPLPPARLSDTALPASFGA